MGTAYISQGISHNGEMLEFLKFQGKVLFSDFCSQMILAELRACQRRARTEHHS